MVDGAESEHGARVDQAVGLVRLQADCSTTEAFVLMHERAMTSGLTMEQIIDALIQGGIRFD